MNKQRIFGIDEIEKIISDNIDTMVGNSRTDIDFRMTILKKLKCDYIKFKKAIIENIIRKEFKTNDSFNRFDNVMRSCISNYVKKEIDIAYSNPTYVTGSDKVKVNGMPNNFNIAILKETEYIINCYKKIEEVYECTGLSKNQLISNVQSRVREKILKDINDNIISTDDINVVYRYTIDVLDDLRKGE